LGQFLDARYTVRAAFSHDVRRAEFARELLPRRVAAHRDDPLGTQLPGGEHAEQTHRAVSDDHHGLARLHIRRDGGEPARAQDVGQCEQTRDQVRGRHLRRGHERAVEISALHVVFAPAWYFSSLTFSIHYTALPLSSS